METSILAEIGVKRRSFLVRHRMRALARILVWFRSWNPRLLHYLETLEAQVADQERELRALRWALKGEQLGRWDEELDIRNWRIRAGKEPSVGTEI